jgi:regulator of protease activity HflC (stomatin/prohibitin superfamily)
MKNIFYAIALLVALSGCTQVDTGNVGVERTLGNVKQETLPPGVYMTIFKTVDEFTAKEVPLQISDLKPKSRDNLTMTDVDVDVYFKINPSKMAMLYTKYQGDVSNVMKPGNDGKLEKTGDEIVGMGRVLREARESVFRAVAQFDATTMHLKRDEIANAIRTILQKELNGTDPQAFEVTNVNVRSLVTDPALEKSIRERAQVDQQIEAKIKQGELAKAEANRLLIEAQGQAAANNAINASITDKLIRMREIAAQESIASKAGNTTIMVPYGTNPLVQIK